METNRSLLRDLIEQNTGIFGQAIRNARLRQEEKQRVQREVERIEADTAEKEVVKTSLAVTYKNFQQIDKDLEILARAMAAQIALEDEDSELGKEVPRKGEKAKKFAQVIAQQNKKDEDDLNVGLDNILGIFRRIPRTPKKPRGGRRTPPKPKTPIKKPPTPRVPVSRAPIKVPPASDIEQRARRVSRNAYNRAIASGLSPEEARARAQLEYDVERRRLQTGQPRNLDLGDTRRVEALNERENKLRVAETDVQKRYAEMRARAQAQADDIENQRKQIAAERANVERQRAQAINEQRAIESSKAQLAQERVNVERQRAQATQAEAATRANVEAQRAALQSDFEQRAKALEVQKQRLTTIQNEYIRSWAQRQVQLEAQQRVAAERITSSAAIGSAAVAEAKRAEVIAATAVAEHKAELARVTRESNSVQADIDREMRTLRSQQTARIASIQAIQPTPIRAPTPQPTAPQKVVHIPLNGNARAAVSAVVKNKIVGKISETVYKKLPLIGLFVVGGIATWQLVQGKAAQAAITVAEGFDPTIIGVTAATFLPQLKLETYFDTYGVGYNFINESELAKERYKEISDIVDEQWDLSVQEMKDSWQKTGDVLKESWRRDLERGVGATLRESISGQPTVRGRGRNVLPPPGQGSVVQLPPISGAQQQVGRVETVGDAIREAAKLTGVDESILLAMAKQESTFNPAAKATTSSAKGLFQFLDSTWNEMINRYGKNFPQLYNGPYDPLASAIAGALYIQSNSRILQQSNIPITGTNIYASHFLGAGGATKLLTADPNAIAAELLPKAAAANENIFFTGAGGNRVPRTVQQVIDVLYQKVGRTADEYATLLAQGQTGTDIINATRNVNIARQQRGGAQPPVVIVAENTRYVSVASNAATSRRETIPMVGSG